MHCNHFKSGIGALRRGLVSAILAALLLPLLATGCCNPSPKTDYRSFMHWFESNLGPDTPKEAQMRAAGLVDIHDLDSSLAVQLIYTGPFNFMGHQLYHGFSKAFMRPELAEKVVAAAKELKQIRPTANLVIYDAARPISIQKEMWDSVVGTPGEEFVANPYKGNGLHNYGAAVDVAIIDCTGNLFPMGSEYDFFGDEARTDIEAQLLKSGRITQREYENRLLLRKVMTDQGLMPIASEWWHFNLMSAAQARETLPVIE